MHQPDTHPLILTDSVKLSREYLVHLNWIKVTLDDEGMFLGDWLVCAEF